MTRAHIMSFYGITKFVPTQSVDFIDFSQNMKHNSSKKCVFFPWSLFVLHWMC